MHVYSSKATISFCVLALALGCAGSDEPAGGAGSAAGSSAGSGAGAAAGGTAGQAGTVSSGVAGQAGTAAGVAGNAAAGSSASTLDASVPNDAADPPSTFDGGSYDSQPLAAGPKYNGSLNGGAACDHEYSTTGFEPVGQAGERHPLFLYFVGTIFSSSDQSSKYDCKAGAAVTEAMARRGFVALSVEYDNMLSLQFEAKLKCLFGSSNAANLLARACALPQVDCSKGIATWGHSQGALVAHAASTDARVRAVWTTGYGGFGAAPLAANRLRVVNGEADTMNSDFDKINEAARFAAGDCPDDGRKECLRADGSGWIIVQKKDCKLTSADHCWFSKKNCGENAEMLEPNWTDVTSTLPFALEANADWVAQTVARP